MSNPRTRENALSNNHGELRALVRDGRLHSPSRINGRELFVAHVVVDRIRKPVAGAIDLPATAPIRRRLAPSPDVDFFGNVMDRTPRPPAFPQVALRPRPAPPPSLPQLMRAANEPRRPQLPAGQRLVDEVAWTIPEIAALTNLHARAIERLVRSGELPRRFGDMVALPAAEVREAVQRLTGGRQRGENR